MPRHNLVPLIFMLCSFLLILWLTHTQNRYEHEHILLETDITAEQVGLRLSACFEARAALVHSLANSGWNSAEQIRAQWMQRAGALFPLHEGILALNYIDSDWIIREIYPRSGNEAALDADLRQNTNAAVPAALARAEGEDQLVRTDTIQLLQSGSGIALYRRILDADGALLGFVNGVLRLDTFMNSCLSEEPLRDRFEFSVSENGRRFFSQPAGDPGSRAVYRILKDVDILGSPWTLEFTPSAEYLSEESPQLELLWLVLGSSLVLLLGLILRALLMKQESLDKSRSKYRLLVENQKDMLVQIDAQGRLLYVSPSYCRTFGMSEEELLDRNFMPLVHEDDKEATRLSLQALKQPPHSSYHEQRARTAEGWRWLAWSNTALLNRQGEIETITAVGRDITRIKNMEASMAQTQKMHALGQMAGGISHDFNNLLQVILGNLELVQLEHGDDSELQQKLQRIRQAVESAMSLTARLSTLSRQEHTRRQPVELNALLTELMGLLQRTLPSSIAIKLNRASRELLVEADPTQLEQVVLNICFNARDAIGQHGALSISLQQAPLPSEFPLAGEQDRDAYACLSISDDGSGIPEELLDRIFDPFFTTKLKGSGTGLGLANCYSIIKDHGGEIHVESTEGLGSTFFIYLPLGSAGDGNDETEGQQQGQLSPLDSRKTLALVVDDDPGIRELVAQLLQQIGYLTLGAVNGEEAVSVFRQQGAGIGLIVMDIMMPQMDGREAARLIHEIDPGVSILFISGYIPPDDEALKHRTLKKPFTRQQLLLAVQQLLQ